MKLTIDLTQSPAALLTDLTHAVRFALGAKFYIEEADDEPAFTKTELTNPAINVPNGLPALPLPNGAALPAATAGSTPASVAIDSEGQPWDSDIHSAGKSKIANGTWKLKKGMSERPDFVAQIKARNLAAMATPLPATPPAAVLPTLPTLPAGAGSLPGLPPVAAVPAADVEIVVTDYPSFAQFVAQQVVKHGDKATNELNRGLTHYQLVDPTTGAPQLELMAHRPEMIDTFYKWFKTVLGA